MKTYNNNEKQVMNSTFSSMTFANSESKIAHTKLNIASLNRLLKVGIALQTDSKNDYATYDNENQITVYISWAKAKVLHDMIEEMKNNKSVHNVCIELKGGLFKVSDGSEFGVNTPCFSITYGNENGDNVVIYQTKDNYSGAYNFDGSDYKTMPFPMLELDAFQTVLEEYYKAATYAIAASIMEASMYKREYTNNMIYAIAEKVGASVSNSNSKGNYNNKTYLNNNNNNNQNVSVDSNNEYTQSTFDDIANAMIH